MYLSSKRKSDLKQCKFLLHMQRIFLIKGKICTLCHVIPAGNALPVNHWKISLIYHWGKLDCMVC